MPRRRIPSRFFAALTAFSLLAGCAGGALGPLAKDAPAFGVLGDTPYSEDQVKRLDRLIGDMNAQPLAFVVHLGDIGTSRDACGEQWLEARREQFSRIRAPFVLVPGDNEWSDCHMHGADPVERLRRVRELFCFTERFPEEMRLERQAGEYCEHLRWRLGDTLFVTVNVPGNNNNTRHSEHQARMRAVLAWLDEAEKLRPGRLVVLLQANPFVPRTGYRPLLDRLSSMAVRAPGRVVLVHGDTHLFHDDQPLPGLRRVEVWGAPWVNWLRGSLAGGELRVEQAPQY